MKPDSPFAPYALQILGLTFILPVVIITTKMIDIDSQAVMGLLGTIVGYIFGTSQNQATKTNLDKTTNKPSPAQSEPNEEFSHNSQ